MRIRHWQGYGCVDAKRVSKHGNPDGTVSVEISVTGEHEYGLVRDDPYDVHRWLLSRFAKDCPDYRSIRSIRIDSPEGGAAVYRVTYAPSP